MCFLAASALRIYTIISVIFHEGPQFVELSESLIHLVRDKSRKGSFQKRKATRTAWLFWFHSSLSLQRIQCNVVKTTVSRVSVERQRG